MNDRALISWVFPTARLWCLDTPHRCQYSTGHCYNLHCSHSLSARQKSGKDCLVVLQLISNVLNPSENVPLSDNMINILLGSWWSMNIMRVFVCNLSPHGIWTIGFGCQTHILQWHQKLTKHKNWVLCLILYLNLYHSISGDSEQQVVLFQG